MVDKVKQKFPFLLHFNHITANQLYIWNKKLFNTCS